MIVIITTQADKHSSERELINSWFVFLNVITATSRSETFPPPSIFFEYTHITELRVREGGMVSRYKKKASESTHCWSLELFHAHTNDDKQQLFVLKSYRSLSLIKHSHSAHSMASQQQRTRLESLRCRFLFQWIFQHNTARSRASERE